MNGPLAITLLAAFLAPSLAYSQNTGAQATPQTRNSAPAAVRGSNPSVAKKPGSISAPAPAARHRGAQARSKAAAHAANGPSQIQIIGANNPQEATTAALPGVPAIHNALGIATGTPITIRLTKSVSSADVQNGDTVHASLAQPLGTVPSGAPVDLTVVAAAKAGVVGSGGVLSLQIISVNGEPILSQIITAQGQAGAKLTPDAAPALGSEAVFAQDQPLTLPAS